MGINNRTGPEYAYKRQQRRFWRREEVRRNKLTVICLGWFMSLIGHIIMALFMTFIFLIGYTLALIPLLLTFIFGSLFRLIRKRVKKQDIPIFVKTEIQNKLIQFLKKTAITHKNLLQEIGNSLKQESARNSILTSTINNQHTPWGSFDDLESGKKKRYCNICGSGLGRGRIKYCSFCRPTYRKTPFDY